MINHTGKIALLHRLPMGNWIPPYGGMTGNHKEGDSVINHTGKIGIITQVVQWGNWIPPYGGMTQNHKEGDSMIKSHW